MKSPATQDDSGYARLESQIAWYDRKSVEAQALYKGFRMTQLGVSALIPLAAYLDAKVATTALAGLILVLESAQQLNQWQANWITYRSTCENLRHEKYAYLGEAGEYANLTPALARRRLVERVEGLVSTEHSKWVVTQGTKPKKAGA